MKKLIILSLTSMLMLSSCATVMTHKVGYPASSDLYVTLGDDPGSESQKPYIPKGQIIHITNEMYWPIPILGMFLKAGNAEPQYVFDKEVIPQVKRMGGDAIIGARVNYTPAGPMLMGLIGLRTGARIVIVGQVVKR